MRAVVQKFPNNSSLALEWLGHGESAEAAMRVPFNQTLATRLIERYPQRPEGRQSIEQIGPARKVD
jgi:hypothetical protein